MNNTVLKEKLLRAFRFMIRLCEEHNLSYFTCGGTTLGAIRHNDIIPWDDDIDIYMPRPDYNRLLALSASLEGTGYKIDYLDDKGYYLPYAKLCDTHTTIWEVKELPYIVGVFIDIFPLDYVSGPIPRIVKEQEHYYRVFLKYRDTLLKYEVKDISKFIFRHPRYFVRSFIPSFFHNETSSAKALERFRHLEGRIDRSRTDQCVCLTQWIGKVFQSVWFDSYINVPFADFEVRVPEGYDPYLTLLYGDYRTPPPVERRYAEHAHYYINLKERLNLEQVRQRIQAGETEVW